MSESFDVIVFHVLEDGETVADRAHVDVSQCFDNQVWHNLCGGRSETWGRVGVWRKIWRQTLQHLQKWGMGIWPVKIF